MAKSYITQFTEYVSEQQKQLRNKLKSKGLNPSPNATLGSLVGNLDNLQESFKGDKYVRDPNLPDIDELFDKDPLRAENGGIYKGCCYFIVAIDGAGKIGVPYNTSSYSNYNVTLPIEHVLVGDTVIYEGDTVGTQSIVYNVPSEDRFITEDGFECCVLKYYFKEHGILAAKNGTSQNSLWYPPNWIEAIDDYQTVIVNNITDSKTISGLASNTIYNSHNYLRYVKSATTKDDLASNYEVAAVYSNIKCLRIDGLFGHTTFSGDTFEQLIFNGEFVGTTLTFGGTSGGSMQTSVEYLQLPYTENKVTVNMYWGIKTLIIPDCAYTLGTLASGSTYYGVQQLQRIHFGNKMTAVSPLFSYCKRIKHVTCSENAFGLNETAITIDFQYASISKTYILNFINNLADRTGMTANILKLSAFTKSFLTDEEKAILTNKNWTLS